MIFTSFEFVGFFFIVLLVQYRLSSLEARKWFLLVASYVFYMSWSIPCVALILTTSLVDYTVGRCLGQTKDTKLRKRLVVLSVVVNLGMLSYFKYTNFFLESIWGGLLRIGVGVDPVFLDIILPVGISFFIFQSMSHTLDVYRGVIQPCRNARDFLLYVSFFPQLVAGPIVRAKDFLPQLMRATHASAREIETGLVLIALGTVKKMVLSDQVAPHVDMIFANPEQFDAFTLGQGVLGYSVQIYCDFSGYSDIAIGCARIMGYRFPANFSMPYHAATITEFWRRWHISLSTWLRDYVYIPLGGNRKGRLRTYINLMTTMLLGGLWHGASWNFILWGGIHGLALAVEKAWMSVFRGRRIPREGIGEWSRWVTSRGLTLMVVMVGWVFFRAHSFDDAILIIQKTLIFSTEGTRVISHQILAAILAVVVVHVLISKDRYWVEEIASRSIFIRIVAYTALGATIVCFAATHASPFIYFQF